MRTRAARNLRTDLLALGVDAPIAEELHRATVGKLTKRRARVTAAVAERCVRSLLSGELDPDAAYRRIWGMGIDLYFAEQPPDSRHVR